MQSEVVYLLYVVPSHPLHPRELPVPEAVLQSNAMCHNRCCLCAPNSRQWAKSKYTCTPACTVTPSRPFSFTVDEGEGKNKHSKETQREKAEKPRNADSPRICANKKGDIGKSKEHNTDTDVHMLPASRPLATVLYVRGKCKCSACACIPHAAQAKHPHALMGFPPQLSGCRG